MCEVYRFPLEMQPARPYPPPDPRHQSVIESAYEPPTEEQWERLDGIEATRRLCERYGYARVSAWVKNLAAISGEAI